MSSAKEAVKLIHVSSVLQLSFPSHKSMDFSSPATPRSPVSPRSPGSSEFGSPQPRRHITSGASSRSRSRARARSNGNRTSAPAPLPLARLSSQSSATFFFGPAIQSAKPVIEEESPKRPGFYSRHSYAGSQSTFPWGTPAQPPPHTSPLADSGDMEEEMFFSSGLGETSFTSFTEHLSPSPRRKPSTKRGLPKKYKPRDSGICLSEDEASFHAVGSGGIFSSMSTMPSASTSVSTVQSALSDPGHGLVTPMLGPGEHSGWPPVDNVRVVDGSDPDVDMFIQRTLAAGAKDASDLPGPALGGPGGKKGPGTPVKKVKTAFIANRPWQSAMMFGKVGLPFIGPAPGEEEENNAPAGGKKAAKKKPRASLPAAFAFPDTGKKVAGKRKLPGLPLGLGKSSRNSQHEGEGDEDPDPLDWSPSASKEPRYSGIGLGRPASTAAGVTQRAKWLMRRSSSGQFDSGSESVGSAGTPTRAGGISTSN
jgi:mitosis inhibitor protein kinase SWE1